MPFLYSIFRCRFNFACEICDLLSSLEIVKFNHSSFPSLTVWWNVQMISILIFLISNIIQVSFLNFEIDQNVLLCFMVLYIFPFEYFVFQERSCGMDLRQRWEFHSRVGIDFSKFVFMVCWIFLSLNFFKKQTFKVFFLIFSSIFWILYS